jgi:hypothetical protein
MRVEKVKEMWVDKVKAIVKYLKLNKGKCVLKKLLIHHWNIYLVY